MQQQSSGTPAPRGRTERKPIHQEVSEAAIEALNHALKRATESVAADNNGVLPADAWQLLNDGHAVLVDVRTAEERKFVGYVPGSAHVPWMMGTALVRNPRFLRELEAAVSKESIVILLCRSGKRSAAAAEAAARGGFKQVYNVLTGFEGDLDEQHQRGRLNGWRHTGLPWVQE